MQGEAAPLLGRPIPDPRIAAEIIQRGLGIGQHRCRAHEGSGRARCGRHRGPRSCRPPARRCPVREIEKVAVRRQREGPQRLGLEVGEAVGGLPRLQVRRGTGRRHQTECHPCRPVPCRAWRLVLQKRRPLAGPIPSRPSMLRRAPQPQVLQRNGGPPHSMPDRQRMS